MLKGGVFLLVISVFVALLLGGFLHAIIPHEHENETIWNSLHAALRHEEKYALLALVVATWFSRIFFAPRIVLFVRRLREIAPRLTRIEKALHRGILAYRKFD